MRSLAVLSIFLAGCGFVDKRLFDSHVKKRLRLQAEVERMADVLREQDSQLRLMMKSVERQMERSIDHADMRINFLERQLHEHEHER